MESDLARAKWNKPANSYRASVSRGVMGTYDLKVRGDGTAYKVKARQLGLIAIIVIGIVIAAVIAGRPYSPSGWRIIAIIRRGLFAIEHRPVITAISAIIAVIVIGPGGVAGRAGAKDHAAAQWQQRDKAQQGNKLLHDRSADGVVNEAYRGAAMGASTAHKQGKWVRPEHVEC